MAIDDLRKTCEENLARREEQLPLARRIVEEETRLFVNHARHARIAPTIRSLRETAAGIQRAELERLLRRLPNIDVAAREEITRAMERVVNKILHPPLESLRQDDAQGTGKPLNLIDAVRRLFQLRED